MGDDRSAGALVHELYTQHELIVPERGEGFGKLLADIFDRYGHPLLRYVIQRTEEIMAIHRRPTPKSLDSLNLTLQKLEQTSGSCEDEASISGLKRIVLNRIADLELTNKLETEVDEIDDAAESADFILLPLMAEEGVE